MMNPIKYEWKLILILLDRYEEGRQGHSPLFLDLAKHRQA